MSPSDPCSAPLRAPIEATGWLRPRLSRLSPRRGWKRLLLTCLRVLGADAPRLGTVAPSELEELSSPPRPKTCATRRNTALEWSGRGSNPQPQHCEGSECGSFNPLGGGAGVAAAADAGALRSQCSRYRFNPLGGGAGSGSGPWVGVNYHRPDEWFQSPRRWGAGRAPDDGGQPVPKGSNPKKR